MGREPASENTPDVPLHGLSDHHVRLLGSLSPDELRQGMALILEWEDSTEPAGQLLAAFVALLRSGGE